MSLRDPLEVLGYRLASALCAKAPLAALQAAASAGAKRLFDRGGRRATWALANLRIAFPDWSEERCIETARQSYVHFAWNVIDALRAERWSPAELRAHVSVRSVEHGRRALEGGRGAIALTLHMGCFELAATAVPVVGLPSATVARTLRNRLLYRRIKSSRERLGTLVIDRRGAARGILRALAGGRIVAILNDQYSSRSRGVFVPFFGVRCSTSAGIATLALRKDAPVIPYSIHRDAPDHHTLAFEPPLELPSEGSRSERIEAATALFNRKLEQIIRRHPEQWMWGHRRFRHSPDLEGDLYADAGAARPPGGGRSPVAGRPAT